MSESKLSLVIKHMSTIESNRIFVGHEIPSEKLFNALRSYAIGALPDETILLIDDTVMGGARSGVLLTEDFVFAYATGSGPRKVSLRAIRSVNVTSILGIHTVKINGEVFIKSSLIERSHVEVIAEMLREVGSKAWNNGDVSDDTTQAQQIAAKKRKRSSAQELNRSELDPMPAAMHCEKGGKRENMKEPEVTSSNVGNLDPAFRLGCLPIALSVFGLVSICMGIFGFTTSKPTGEATITSRGWLRAAIEDKPEYEVEYHYADVDADFSERMRTSLFGAFLIAIAGAIVITRYRSWCADIEEWNETSVDFEPVSKEEEPPEAHQETEVKSGFTTKQNNISFQSGRVFVGDSIPESKLRNAIRSYGSGTKPEDILLLADNTILENAKCGLMVTADSLIAKASFESCTITPIKDIWSLKGTRTLFSGGLDINDGERYISLETIRNPDFDQLVRWLHENVLETKVSPNEFDS